jgi:hypothetical protein
MTMTAEAPVKPVVTKFATSPTTAIFMVGDLTFDDVDRDLAYIDRQIHTWLTWRGYVAEHGEYTRPES